MSHILITVDEFTDVAAAAPLILSELAEGIAFYNRTHKCIVEIACPATFAVALSKTVGTANMKIYGMTPSDSPAPDGENALAP